MINAIKRKNKFHLQKFSQNPRIPKKAKKKPPTKGAKSQWSSLRESNPYNQLGKLVFCH